MHTPPTVLCWLACCCVARAAAQTSAGLGGALAVLLQGSTPGGVRDGYFGVYAAAERVRGDGGGGDGSGSGGGGRSEGFGGMGVIPSESGGRRVYLKRGASGAIASALWYDAAHGLWIVGSGSRIGSSTGVMYAHDGSLLPEAIASHQWHAWDGHRWTPAPGVLVVPTRAEGVRLAFDTWVRSVGWGALQAVGWLCAAAGVMGVLCFCVAVRCCRSPLEALDASLDRVVHRTRVKREGGGATAGVAATALFESPRTPSAARSAGFDPRSRQLWQEV